MRTLLLTAILALTSAATAQEPAGPGILHVHHLTLTQITKHVISGCTDANGVIAEQMTNALICRVYTAAGPLDIHYTLVSEDNGVTVTIQPIGRIEGQVIFLPAAGITRTLGEELSKIPGKKKTEPRPAAMKQSAAQR